MSQPTPETSSGAIQVADRRLFGRDSLSKRSLEQGNKRDEFLSDCGRNESFQPDLNW
jgi:hypothetical protein